MSTRTPVDEGRARECLARRLRATYLDEVEEHVRSLERDFGALAGSEREGDPGPLHGRLFQTARNLRRAARSVGVGVVEAACRHVEEILEAATDGRMALGGAHLELLSRTGDAIHDASRRLRAGSDLAGSPLEALVPTLGAVGRGAPAGDVSASDAPGGAAAVPPGDPDRLLAGCAGLDLAAGRLEERSRELALLAARSEGRLTAAFLQRLGADLDGDRRLLAETAGEIEDEVRRVRSRPFAEACVGLERTVRALARGAGKEVDLAIEGGRTEIDLSIVGGLKWPLLHLVKNAVLHGIETPAERISAGKSATGRVRISATIQGSLFRVEVADDGRGLDLPAAGGGAGLVRLLFGCTAPAGPGRGLDLVRAGVETMRGAVRVANDPGHGLSFAIEIPRALERARILLVSSGGQTCAFDAANVGGLLRFGREDLGPAGGREFLFLRGGPVPVVRLGRLLGSPPREDGVSNRLEAVLLESFGSRAVAVVDEILDETVSTVRSPGERLGRLPLVSGAAILPDLGLVFVLSAAEIVARALRAAP